MSTYGNALYTFAGWRLVREHGVDNHDRVVRSICQILCVRGAMVCAVCRWSRFSLLSSMPSFATPCECWVYVYIA